MLAADVAARTLFQATDHDVIQRMGGGVEMLAQLRETHDTGEVLTEAFPFRSLRCIGNCSDDKICNTQYYQTDR